MRDNIIYITGGTSRLAKHVIEIVEGTPLHRGSLTDGIKTDYSFSSLREIFKDAEIVIHLAGKVHGSFNELYSSNYLLTKRIIESLPSKTKLIYASSISIYRKKVKKADENTKINPDTDYAKTKALAEQLVLKRKGSVSHRIGILYAENFNEYFELFKLIEKGKAFLFGSGKNKLPLVYAKDVALAIKNSIDKEGTYILSAPSIEQEKAFKLASSFLGVEFKPKRISFIQALLFSKVNSIFNFNPLLKEEIIYSLSSDREFITDKAEKELKFSPIPTEEGIKKMVDYYLKNKSSFH